MPAGDFGEQYVQQHRGLASLKETLEREAMSQLPRLRRLPNQVGEILEQASSGRLSAKVSFLSDERDQALLTKLVDRIVFAVLAAALGLGSVVLLGVESGPKLTDDRAAERVPRLHRPGGLGTARDARGRQRHPRRSDVASRTSLVRRRGRRHVRRSL